MTGRHDPATLERLLFRRQFMLGKTYVERFASWQKVDLGKGVKLTVHPDLEVQRAGRGERWMALLGYALDPDHPSATNADILGSLLDRLDTCEGLLPATDRLGGRWILVVHDGARTILFTDAVGMRQAFFASPAGVTWCASQPGLLAEVLDLPADEGAAAFTRTEKYVGDAQAWYPGDATPYEGARLLLPNHYLDLETGLVTRYWPREDLQPMPLDAAVDRCVQTLRGLVAGARARFAMSLAMTAGWDSRLILAATRDIAPDVFYFTGIFWNMDATHMDAASPSRLLSALGLKNHLIACQDVPDEAFRRVFRRNVVMGHDAYAPVAEALLAGCPPDRVCVKGDVAEIAKCYLRMDSTDGSGPTAVDLARLVGMDPHPFVLRAFDGWLAGARPRNVALLDLFCWEQPMGVLEAMVEAECDIAQEAFSPLDCRDLLVTMLRVDEKYRRPPTFILFTRIIAELWPEVLSEPINGEAQTGPKAFLRRAMTRLPVRRLVPRRIRRLARKVLS